MSANKKCRRTKELETLGVLAAFFLLLNMITHRQLCVFIALALLLIALFVKPLAGAVSAVWLKFAEVIGALNNKLVLTLVFYCFLTPMAVLYRTFTKNPLMLKSEKTSTTFYTEREQVFTRSDFEKMW